MIYAMILAGGGGTRLWPESRRKRPKQFVRLSSEGTMLTQTFLRLGPLVAPNRTLIVTREEFLPLVYESLPSFPKANILAEPVPRSTAPAIGYAALEVTARHKEGILIVVPSDQIIEPTKRFQETLRRAAALVKDDPKRVVTLGIRPDRPADGYGYMKLGEAIESKEDAPPAGGSIDAFHLVRFCEKPDPATAQRYLDEGGYLWNSGIFIARASRFLELLAEHQPEISSGLDRLRPLIQQTNKRDEIAAVYEAFPSISIDYGVMEKADGVVTLAADFSWSDVGSFESLDEDIAPDDQGNRARGIRLAALDCHNNHIRWKVDQGGDPETLLAMIDVDGLQVIRQGNVLLITRRGNDRRITTLLDQLTEMGLEDYR